MSSETPLDPLESAEQHAGLSVPASGVALPKRVVERLTRFLLGPQRAYNRGVIDAIRLLRADNQQLGDRIAVLEQGVTAVSGTIARLKSDITELRAQSSDAVTEAALTRGQVVDLAQAVQRIEPLVAQPDITPPSDSAHG